ncbi:hypothetical protein MYCTH_2299868 [Thermothelomyces thermophilus ATCC 42464]|uniref:Uncharacterized protein n=1 Tax=Thermothelomyces thermophilus (strain ATCC 42464 / BCRC 31852 / DSM 1799) TaxID=573729 RepID=G2Q065_THET4|nr:uncharacterized protein MYCTH_2299868 [Thermothelomyces thermophilus ATCC 42464]AEO55739.1 hypothetical protein MYCTH_2299868 [Thermothelomyces thermophilus ATCC 42464]
MSIDDSDDDRFDFTDSEDRQEEDVESPSLSRGKKESPYMAIIKDIRRFKKRRARKSAVATPGTEDNNHH